MPQKLKTNLVKTETKMRSDWNNMKPIVVTNPKDKRLKAYNDSLSAYKNTRNDPDGVDVSPKNWSVKKLDDPSVRYQSRYYYWNEIKHPKLKPIGMATRGDDGITAYYPVYKKPVQPYVLEKSKPKNKVKDTPKATPKTEAPIQKKDTVKEEKQFYQGRNFMDSTGLRPNYYTKSEIASAVKNKNNKK